MFTDALEFRPDVRAVEARSRTATPFLSQFLEVLPLRKPRRPSFTVSIEIRTELVDEVLDYVLAETLDGLTTHAGHDAAVDLLDRIEENTRFHIDSLSADALATGKALFRQHEPLSFVDACSIAYMRTGGLGHLYAFDDDFDAAEDVYRLDTATNPYDPN